MRIGDYIGQRVRLRADLELEYRVRSRLVESQEAQGIEGFIVEAESKDERLFFEVKLENVPNPYRVAAEDCKLIAG